jgi:hypothetical protein
MSRQRSRVRGSSFPSFPKGLNVCGSTQTGEHQRDSVVLHAALGRFLEAMPTNREEARSSTTPVGRIGTFHPTTLPATSDTVIPPTTPIRPPARLRIEDSIKNCAKMDFWRAPTGASYSNLPCSLRHGNKHDVHDADPSRQRAKALRARSANGSPRRILTRNSRAVPIVS